MNETNQLQLFNHEEVDPDKVHREILAQCYREAGKSLDPSTQVGAVIVSPDGWVYNSTLSCNGFTEGWIPTEIDFERPRKYNLFEHAERRAVYRSAREGITLEGCTLYASYAACCDCSRAITESGIKRLIRHSQWPGETTARWSESIQLGEEIMRKAGITIIDITGPIPGAVKILMNGENYDPA